MKTCTKCGGAKDLSQFYADKNGAQGRKSQCKLCMNAAQYKWRESNPGQHAAAQERYRNRNPEKARAAVLKWQAEHGTEYERQRYARRQNDPLQRSVFRLGQKAYKARRRAAGPLTSATVRAILSKPCAYCGAVATEVDHVLPVSRGGTNVEENLAPACAPCNQSKGSRTPEEWRACGNSTIERRRKAAS